MPNYEELGINGPLRLSKKFTMPSMYEDGKFTMSIRTVKSIRHVDMQLGNMIVPFEYVVADTGMGMLPMAINEDILRRDNKDEKYILLDYKFDVVREYEGNHLDELSEKCGKFTDEDYEGFYGVECDEALLLQLCLFMTSQKRTLLIVFNMIMRTNTHDII